uniref:Cytochrome c oxidase subunit 2 n=2 Tax=Oecanthus TaxID=208682 RepID=A0A1W6S5T6_9ORTH|nr:cytochrome c oxidase subunit II [Oecanthus sinensis]AQM39916.1 cytochrome c oxidase subunit 2 [Oecanthus rufescens]ARO75198.1 cytochrome c oxidase subunit II [Oecanthus sinensis]
MATWSNLNLQNSSSPLMEQLIFFHDHSLLILLMITIMVSYIMFMLFFNKLINRFLLEGQMIEIIWTILPAVTLIFIALPSLRLLYLLDESMNPLITLKTIGHQWYWSYEYMDFSNLIEFDSYMSPLENNNSFRLLDVDNRTVLPMNTQVRTLVTSSDVIHSWTIPTLGMKTDATPGRLNQISFMINRPGVFFGQCSEICGTNHSFMPIAIESVNIKSFISWLKSFM